MTLLNILKSRGEFEINRTVGAFGAVVYIVTAPAFVIWDMIRNNAHFDIVAYCAAYPGGLGLAVGCIAGAVAVKDRAVAAAKVVSDTGSLPGVPQQGQQP